MSKKQGDFSTAAGKSIRARVMDCYPCGDK